MRWSQLADLLIYMSRLFPGLRFIGIPRREAGRCEIYFSQEDELVNQHDAPPVALFCSIEHLVFVHLKTRKERSAPQPVIAQSSSLPQRRTRNKQHGTGQTSWTLGNNLTTIRFTDCLHQQVWMFYILFPELVAGIWNSTRAY